MKLGYRDMVAARRKKGAKKVNHVQSVKERESLTDQPMPTSIGDDKL
jgi:hypothetical protein